jgi:hypothetical protein
MLLLLLPTLYRPLVSSPTQANVSNPTLRTISQRPHLVTLHLHLILFLDLGLEQQVGSTLERVMCLPGTCWCRREEGSVSIKEKHTERENIRLEPNVRRRVGETETPL